METVLHKAGLSRTAPSDPVDPITTEVVRHALNSAANQMKRALVRTAFSPVIYEVLDFAVALYDRDVRLLAQAPSLPMFMGTLNFCVTEAVKGIGGEENLNEGDIIIYNWPYGTGSHPQDLAVVMPAFHGGELVGYAAIKGHWLDIGGKDPYCTDTIDVFQEGTIYPGVKIVEAGRMVDPIYRIILANWLLSQKMMIPGKSALLQLPLANSLPVIENVHHIDQRCQYLVSCFLLTQQSLTALQST